MPGGVPRSVTAVLVAACLTVLTACTVGPSQRPPVAVRGDTAPPVVTLPTPTPGPKVPDLEPQSALLDFVDCTTEALAELGPPPDDRTLRVECGEIIVPTDHDDTSAGHTTLSVTRVGLADAPDDRPALLVVGDSATEPSARFAVTLAARVPTTVLETFTLVGLDRRGAGADVLDCAPAEARAAILDTDPVAVTMRDLQRLLAHARDVVQDCYLLLSNTLRTYRSAATASDVEFLRVALGTNRLSAIGVGDGADALLIWADENPLAVGRLVLDGPSHPAAAEPEAAKARAAAAEAAFDRFAEACRSRPGCPLGADPRSAVSRLVEQLRERPLFTGDDEGLTAGRAVTALLVGLAEPNRWAELAAALAAAANGDPSGLLAVLEPVIGPDGRFDAELATTCNDTARRLSPPEVVDLAARWRAEHPLFGVTFATRLLACSPWPVGDAAEPDPGPGTPPVLVLGTAAGTRTDLAGTRAAADTLPEARFVSWQGAGVGAYPRTPCVTSAVDGFLVDGTLPPDGMLCPP